MFSRFPELLLIFVCAFSIAGCGNHSARRFRVCADPNNLPFSNEQGEGFENRIAELIADDLGASLEYTWFAQRRGFVRNTLNAGICDAILGVPAGFDPVETTRPYYRSTYVFVSRDDRDLRVESMDDEVLRHVRIGVHVVGDDYSNPPPVHALGSRNIVHNVVGYTVYGDYSKPNPPARLIEAVASGDVDVAIAWGPFGGYFGQRQAVPLRVRPMLEDRDRYHVPFAFEIAMGVKKGNVSLRQQLDTILDSRQPAIDRILSAYGVPLKVMGSDTLRR